MDTLTWDLCQEGVKLSLASGVVMVTGKAVLGLVSLETIRTALRLGGWMLFTSTYRDTKLKMMLLTAIEVDWATFAANQEETDMAEGCRCARRRNVLREWL